MAVVSLVVALTVGTIIAAFLLPIGIDAIVGTEDTTITQDNQTTAVVSGNFNATLDDVNANTDATYTLQTDTASNTVTVSEGSSKTVSLEGYNVTVAVDNAMTASATSTFTSPIELGWGDGAQSLWAILDVIIVLAVFLFFVSVSLGAARRT